MVGRRLGKWVGQNTGHGGLTTIFHGDERILTGMPRKNPRWDRHVYQSSETERRLPVP